MHIVIFVTTKDQAQANRIAEKLVQEKLIACANIVAGGVQSIFRWEGKVDRAEEVLLILKSRRRHFPTIVKRVKALHSYNVPEIIALPIVEGNKDYLKWLTESTTLIAMEGAKRLAHLGGTEKKLKKIPRRRTADA